jgi:heme/copper-type cytochrome/quinol oxidase subunit 2
MTETDRNRHPERMLLSSISLLTAIIVGIVVFWLGYVTNAFRGARKTYKGAKSGVPKARKSYFAHMWILIKWCAGAVLIVAVLLTWTVNDVKDASNSNPSPSPSPSAHASPKPTPRK